MNFSIGVAQGAVSGIPARPTLGMAIEDDRLIEIPAGQNTEPITEIGLDIFLDVAFADAGNPDAAGMF